MESLIAGYITATTVDLARVRRANGSTSLVDRETYTNTDFSDFNAILAKYFKEARTGSHRACFGVAGPVIDNKVTTTNLPWHLNGETIQSDFSIGKVKIVNDLAATARGLFELSQDQFYTINEGEKAEHGNIGLIAAGTGLGEALIYYNASCYHPYASEGGHADFAPGNQVETELREYLYADSGLVEAEDVISLGGLENIYNFLVDTEGASPAEWFSSAVDRPSAIIERALAGADPTAVRALDILIDCYASEAANLALKGMTLGGIYLGGRIAPQIVTAFDSGKFMERFAKKGKMQSLLANMPVNVIIDDKTALRGASAIVQEL